MRIDVLTLFPEMFRGPFDIGIVKRAIDRGLVEINLHNFREYAHDRHHTVDDYSHGGGPGMVLKPEPIFEAVEAVKANIARDGGTQEVPVIVLTPAGRRFTQKIAGELSGHSHLILICGHYEGIDERVMQHMATDQISIGDYVLTGGELPAMVVIDAVVRLLPGVLGSEASPMDDSYVSGLLEYPQYTRPANYRGWQVPDVLLSGNHAEIARWRREQMIIRTLKRRPDLLDRVDLSAEQRELVKRLSAAQPESHYESNGESVQ